jgi:hypothetical protein
LTNKAEFSPDFGSNADVPDEFQDYVSRLEDRLGGDKLATALAPWITKNTRLEDRAFSFREHEFQMQIANDTAEDACIKKCSQVGLSELSVRIILALLAVSHNRSAIYVLPSAKFGQEFSKARFSPVIENSEALTRLLIPGANGAMMKRFGDCILYIGGAANDKQAISRPADALFVDEYDFCDMGVMTKYFSRLRHSRHKFMRFFSTPTVNNYGISKRYDESDMKVYMVKCSHCNEQQPVDWNTQVFIPGFTDKGLPFDQFDKEDVFNDDYIIEDATLRCCKCKKSILSDLANPERREWVARLPTRKSSGYHVRPFDLITYNTVPSIITQFKDYDRAQDYWNFVHGETFASDENQINETVFKTNIKVTPISPEEARGMDLQGFYVGVDVGKTCHYMVGRPTDTGRIEVVWFGKLKPNDGPMKEQICNIFRAYNCYRGVIDAGPDFTLGQSVREELGSWFQQAQYVRGGESHPQSYYKYEEEKDADSTGVISVYRTKAFDSLVTQHNKGKWAWPIMAETDKELLDHMRAMKRIEVPNDDGERKPKWVKVSDMDHFMHSAMYLKTAVDLDNPLGSSVVMPSTTIITGASIGAVLQKQNAGRLEMERSHPVANMIRAFGIR